MQITLTGNSSSSYSFDEPFFKKPRNLKSPPKPPHFEIDFIDVNSSNIATTAQSPNTYLRSSTAQPPSTKDSHALHDIKYSNNVARSKSNSNSSIGISGNPSLRQNMISVLSNKSVEAHGYTRASAIIIPTEEPTLQCVKAYIYQVFDLDREKQDTHYLTITNLAEIEMVSPKI